MNKKQFDNLRGQIFQKCIHRKRKCFLDSCLENAISSHLLQKNGILNYITHNGHLYQTTFELFPKPNYKINKIGINKAMTFKGFCSEHDTTIFRPIESAKEIDFAEYETQLLFSYRTVLNEYREKQILIDFFTEILREAQKRKILIDEERILQSIAAETFAQWDTEYIIKSIENELHKIKGQDKKFEFYLFKLPQLEVGASSVYSLKSVGDSFKNGNIKFENKQLLPILIINIIPQEKETVFLIGFHKDSREECYIEVKKLLKCNEKDLKKEISDMLIRNFVTWSCSTDFYHDKIQHREKSILQHMNFYVRRNQFIKDGINLNLFD